jgi:hypothetical protein
MIWIVLSVYGIVQLWASIVGWRGKMMSRGAFVTMALGSALLVAGSGLDWQGRASGLWLIGIGLVLISDSAYAVGTQRPAGPRLSHHLVRAGIGIALFAGVLIA